ncbi:hypothetical protein LNKW23_24000 [Paralimibaculum aggregatum]|uniref:HPt domain-containing protein n=1 Tax=Paralimibaculum aggregatum TaxID=3036245 RepID=A0ABQ6LJN0_9RHOB|nr:Hpt domain-containing protein [Limibaculum sp. NKW23]GMG83187.1 hypothetical protein LNKW23_24000 [Limibaculum sp. NKW23]
MGESGIGLENGAGPGAAMAPPQQRGATELDRELIGELVESYGVELVGELSASLRAEAAEDLARLDAAIAGGDVAEAARRLHSVRGAALNLGCLGFARCAQHWEKAAEAGRLPGLEERCMLGALLEVSLAELERVTALAAA